MGDLSSEPSMEEILASIKKIIAEDGGKGAAPTQSRRSSLRDVVRDAGEDVSIETLPNALKNRDLPAEKQADSSDSVSRAEDFVNFSAPLEEPEFTNDDGEVLELTDSVAEPKMSDDSPAVTLVSSTTEAVSRTALASLSALVVKPDVHGSDTLEGMVREMLKPMLKDWLDAKLPEMVEAMVAKEIARISGRGL